MRQIWQAHFQTCRIPCRSIGSTSRCGCIAETLSEYQAIGLNSEASPGRSVGGASLPQRPGRCNSPEVVHCLRRDDAGTTHALRTRTVAPASAAVSYDVNVAPLLSTPKTWWLPDDGFRSECVGEKRKKPSHSALTRATVSEGVWSLLHVNREYHATVWGPLLSTCRQLRSV